MRPWLRGNRSSVSASQRRLMFALVEQGEHAAQRMRGGLHADLFAIALEDFRFNRLHTSVATKVLRANSECGAACPRFCSQSPLKIFVPTDVCSRLLQPNDTMPT